MKSCIEVFQICHQWNNFAFSISTLHHNFGTEWAFSVQSAYRLGLNESLRSSSVATSRALDGWRAARAYFWRRPAPPKVCISAWHLATNSLPTWENKHRRNLVPYDVCPLAWMGGRIPTTPFAGDRGRSCYGRQWRSTGISRTCRLCIHRGRNGWSHSLLISPSRSRSASWCSCGGADMSGTKSSMTSGRRTLSLPNGSFLAASTPRTTFSNILRRTRWRGWWYSIAW